MTDLTHQLVQLLTQANTSYRSGNALGALEQLKPAIEADALDGLLLASRIYWSLRQHEMARQVLASSPAHATKPVIQQTLWLLSSHFQLPLSGKNVTLERRGRADAFFVKTCWSDSEFMLKFHRFAKKIGSDQELIALLDAEENANLLTSSALHWTINDTKGNKLGFISLVDFSLPFRRAELIIGLIDPKPGFALEASLLIIDFAFRLLKLNKLCSVIYQDNQIAIAATAHLGFVKEGVLREHIFDQDSKSFVDLHLSSLLANEYFNNAKLSKFSKRLIGL
ncbi:MAG: hypothetical protein RI893_204 [Pseudomonadota bacterium]|jgi:RimJ/RimL family protein N-acetyltransferase